MKFFAFGTNNSAIITISITGKALSPSSIHSLKTSKEQTLNSIQNVQLLHGYRLINSALEVSKTYKEQEAHSFESVLVELGISEKEINDLEDSAEIE